MTETIWIFTPSLEALYKIRLLFTKWLLRKYFKSSKYGKPWLKVKEWPSPLVFTAFYALIWATVNSIFRKKSAKLSMKPYVPSFFIFDLAIKKSKSSKGVSI